MNILIITDNDYLYNGFKNIINKKKLLDKTFDFGYSYTNEEFEKEYNDLFKINFKKQNQLNNIIQKYDMIISLHCKQLFPKKLVEKVECINVHPGYNPYNRGWYPQVFSIINDKPIGVTIHKIDEQLDHGEIIYQKKVKINSWETSKDVYDKLIDLELKLLDNYLLNILNHDYKTRPPKREGNINFKSDFNKLKKIDLNKKVTYKEAIDRLRALTHGDYKNAYFVDEEGNKILVKINLEKDNNS